MRSDTPFLTASQMLAEGCDWLEDLTRPEGDARNECAIHADAWEQANEHLSRAIETLDDHGTDQTENGGQDVPGYGWVPAYTVSVIDHAAVEAAAALQAIHQPLRDLNDVHAIAKMITPELVASLRAAMKPYEGRALLERDCQERIPEPC